MHRVVQLVCRYGCGEVVDVAPVSGLVVAGDCVGVAVGLFAPMAASV